VPRRRSSRRRVRRLFPGRVGRRIALPVSLDRAGIICLEQPRELRLAITVLGCRALCAIGLNDFSAAAADLERVVAREPKYDYQRAAGLQAHALANAGEPEKAGALFADVTQTSTLSETQYNYACFLAAEGRTAEARDWADRILRKKATMPDYIRRRERPWFRKAAALLKQLARA